MGFVVMSTTVSTASSSTSRPETISGMAISLAFWLCLLLSAVLFAIVALSPKLFIYLQLRSQFDANQSRLVSLERQADQLQRVVHAIGNDKEFASELTRIEFDAVRPDEEVIPVDVVVPGCPPPPTAILQGILAAISTRAAQAIPTQ